MYYRRLFPFLFFLKTGSMSGNRNLLYYEDRESRSKVTDERPGNRERDLEHTQRAKPRDHVSVTPRSRARHRERNRFPEQSERARV